jgi:hypothetical protein
MNRLIQWLRGKPVAPTPPKFVSWYRAPNPNSLVEYLAYTPPYDHGQYASKEGEWFYTIVLANAFRFDTIEAARKLTPVYDGSDGIKGRTGVYTVKG